MAEKSELTKIIEQILLTKDYSLEKKVGSILKQYSIDGTWVPTITDGNGKILTHRFKDKEYIPLFSDHEFIVAKGNSVTVTDINKIIAPLLINHNYAGIEINPFVHGMFIDTTYLLQMIIGNCKFYEEQKFDWGKGIPQYTVSDLLDDREIVDFGIQVVAKYCKSKGMDNIYYSNELGACPNLIIKKGNSIAFVLVETDIYPNQPSIKYEDRLLLTKRAKQFGFGCYYASVGIGSIDGLRKEKSIALRGDGYYVNFTRLEEIKEPTN